MIGLGHTPPFRELHGGSCREASRRSCACGSAASRTGDSKAPDTRARDERIKAHLDLVKSIARAIRAQSFQGYVKRQQFQRLGFETIHFSTFGASL